MRTIMLFASIAMIGSGIFCVANLSAAFLSVAFVVGLVFILLSICEILIGRRGDFGNHEEGFNMTQDGVIMGILGAAILLGQLTDDNSVKLVFAMLLTTEGVLSFRREWLDIMSISRNQIAGTSLSVLMLILGISMFFSNLLNSDDHSVPALLLIGLCMIVLGLRRFGQSFNIEYSRPSFITGNEEKLREAEEEEKRALAKAKEGIREQKNAQRRIARIKEDIAAEEDVMMSAAITRKERELERELED